MLLAVYVLAALLIASPLGHPTRESATP
jgi:hypothetical protein